MEQKYHSLFTALIIILFYLLRPLIIKSLAVVSLLSPYNKTNLYKINQPAFTKMKIYF